MTSPSRTLPPAAAAARIAPLLLALAGLAIAIGSQWLWRHRRQIGTALVAAVATTYAAGARLRQHVEALATDAARRLPSQPVAAVAPITATLAAAWGLVDQAASGPAPIKDDDFVSKIMKAIDENNAYLKQRPNIITLSTQGLEFDQPSAKWLRDHGWTVIE